MSNRLVNNQLSVYPDVRVIGLTINQISVFMEYPDD